MISKKTAIVIAGGFAVGGISFVTESALVGIFAGILLPPLCRVTPWLPSAVLVLVTLGMGIACRLVVHVFIRFPKRLVLASVICSYALIEIAILVFRVTNVPEDVAGFWLNTAVAITLAHIGAFTIGLKGTDAILSLLKIPSGHEAR